MGKKEEREAFKQAILKMAKYRLRRVLSEAGCTAQEVREAEVEGEEKMVEIIMTKYDEGAIDFPGLERATGKDLSGGKQPDPAPDGKEPKRTAKKGNSKREEPKDEDPYSGAFDDDDDGSSGDDKGSDDDDDNKGSDDEGGGGEDTGIEDDDKEPPRKAERSKRKSASEDSDIDSKIAKVMDLLLSNIETLVELSEKFDKFVTQHIEFEETVKFAFARIWKLGSAQPLKPGFGEVIEKAKEIAKKRTGQAEE